jgi:DNA-binding NtrC family response regulator
MADTFDQFPPDKDRGFTIVIIDDEETCRMRLGEICTSIQKDLPIHKVAFSSIEEALEFASNHPVHIILIDKYLETFNGSVQNGIQSIPEFLTLQPNVQILVVSGSREIDGVVQAINFGAFGYITKDSDDELVEAQIRKALQFSKLKIENSRLEARIKPTSVKLAGNSKTMKHLMNHVDAVCETNRPVLLLGESGTGKTTLARYIHEKRQKYLRQEGPFFDLNLSAMSQSLIEAELFGNEQGAFTGATKMKQGIIELANNGTLFLDEIGEISPDTQVKLLKVLEEGTFFRLGGTKQLKSRFKLICATNKNLEQMVANGQFREDLYWRISTFTIHVPNLESRSSDIPEIIKMVLPKCCNDNKVHITFEEIPKALIEYLIQNPPPGNIRGLEQCIHHLLVFSPKDKSGRPILSEWNKIIGKQNRRSTNPKTLTPNDFLNLPIDFTNSDFPGLYEYLDSITRKIILTSRKKFRNNAETARHLKISESNVSAKIQEIKNGGAQNE